ncbi:uncharacterized protein L3040_006222 [Drepanopeziza brunnea f. sp. 'multigermtubi']|nr:hypothetical protein L3040_006222 [Drepanopeziza brunnea f. sp. 'multigermtubi']
MERSLSNLTRECWSDCPPIDINELPLDLKHLLLRFMLVSEEPITNPFLQDTDTSYGRIKYGWSKYMRPNILATNKEFYEIGMKMLYGYNTFRFTRLVAQAPPEYWRGGMESVGRFLEREHRLMLDPGKKTIRRSQLIKNFIISDSDLERDEHAKRGIARKPRADPAGDQTRYMLWYLWKLVRYGCDLHNLTITADADSPATLATLEHEAGRVGYHQLSGDGQSRWVKSEAARARNHAHWTAFRKHWTDEGLRVAHVHVRGADAFAGGRMAFAPEMREAATGIWSAKPLPTSSVAMAVTGFFEHMFTAGFVLNRPIISFSGRFTQRWPGDEAEDEAEDEDGIWSETDGGPGASAG